MSATAATGNTWHLPYREHQHRIPATEQQRREWVIERVILMHVDYDADCLDLIQHAVRPDMDSSVLWEKCEQLVHLSNEVEFWERQHDLLAREAAVDDYRDALRAFATSPAVTVDQHADRAIRIVDENRPPLSIVPDPS